MNKNNYLKKIFYILGIMSLVLVGLFVSKTYVSANEPITVTYETNQTGTFEAKFAPNTSAKNYDLGNYQGYKHLGWYEDIDLTVPHLFGPLTQNITLYAKWGEITYTFKLNVLGETDPITVTGTVLDLLTKLESAKPANKTGHVFSDWYLEDTYENKVLTQDDLLIALNHADSNNVVNLYGKQVINKYLATFNFNGVIKYVWVNYGEAITPPEAEVVLGYTLDSVNPYSPALPSVMPDENLTFVANYVKSKVAITFVNDNNEELAVVETEYGKLPNYTGSLESGNQTIDALKYYYIFAGWDKQLVPATEPTTYKATYNKYPYIYRLTQVEGGKTYITDVPFATNLELLLSDPVAPEGYLFASWTGMPLDKLMPAENLTLIAKFVPAGNTAYKVEHYQQELNGNYILVDTDNLTGVTGGNTNAVAKVYQGFTNKAFEQATILADGSTVVRIDYDRNIYQITFNLDGGIETIAPQDVKYGDVVSKPTNPTKVGFDFVKWQKSGVDYVFTTPVSEAFELVAVWTPKGDTPYKVEHYQQGLDGTTYTLIDTDNLTGQTGHMTNATSKDYFGFEAKAFNQVSIDANGTTVVRIDYDRVDVLVMYNLNGGTLTGLEVAKLHKFGETITAPTGNPTKSNYTFTGWSYNFTEPINQVTPITILALYEAETKTLTVTGDEIKVFVNDSNTPYNSLSDTIRYNDNLTLTLNYDSNFVTPKLLINGEEVLVTGNVMNYVVKGDTTIAFTITPIKVNVTFDLKEGNADPLIGSQTINKGALATIPANNPTKLGYTFSHWSASADDAAFDFTMPIMADTALHAVYVIDKHSVIYNNESVTVTNLENTNIESGQIVDTNTSIKITPIRPLGFELVKVEIINNETNLLIKDVKLEDLIDGSYAHIVTTDIKLIAHFKSAESTIDFSLTVPAGTPEDAVIYMIGVFPGLDYPGEGIEPTLPTHQWNNFTPDYIMTKGIDGKYTLSITAPRDYVMKYKYVYTVDGGTTYTWEEDRGSTPETKDREYIVNESRQQDDVVDEWITTPSTPQPGDLVEVKFVVHSVPEGTTQVILLGNFPHDTENFYWNPANGYEMTLNAEGNYEYTLQLPYEFALQYKFHNGTNFEVYSDPNNRNFTVGAVPITADNITAWETKTPPATTYDITFNVTLPDMPTGATAYIIGELPGLEPELPENNTVANAWHNFDTPYELQLVSGNLYQVTITGELNDVLRFKIMYKISDEIVEETQVEARTHTITETTTVTINDVTWKPRVGEMVQVTFNVTVDIPEGKTMPQVLDDQIRLAGGLFGGGAIPGYSDWNTDDTNLRLTKNTDGTYSVILSLPAGTKLLYKYLAGRQWTVYGENGGNREVTINAYNQVINDTVTWKDHIYDLSALDGKDARLVKFTVGNSDSSNNMFIAGNFPQANWNGSYSGLEMTKSADGTQFTLDVWLENNTSYEYKYTRDQDGVPGKKWEPDPNRVLDATTTEVNDTISSWGWNNN